MHTSTTSPIRHDWTLRELHELHNRPFPDLVFEAQATHRAHHDPTKVQLCTLLSIKTGGCPEDCAYCPQSARYQTGLDAEPLMELNDVVAAAEAARAAGSTRFCMGAAWRSAPRGKQFGRVLDMVRAVRSLGMEACCTLGMLEADQAEQLKEAGLTAYNHNLDTGPAFYGNIITTRTYEDRLHTLDRVRRAGITVCCGGIVGMGERLEDRLSMLQVLAAFDPHPESIPINALVRVAGTPLSTQPRVDPLSYVRLVATTRIVFPTSMVRLSAGRNEMSLEAQALCFLAGANSIFAGEKLLTTPNPVPDADARLFDALGLTPASSG